MEVKITTLSENTANFGFIGEWGLSMLVEAEGQRILFDSGMSFSALHNARLIGFDLSSIDRIIISHGHEDHTGGLREVLRLKGEVEIIGHPDIWDAKYVKKAGKFNFSGIPFLREELESLGARFNLTREPVHITDQIMTTGEIPMLNEYEKLEESQLVKRDNNYILDPMADDLALIIKTELGLIAILGCAHHGIINTLRHAQKLTGIETVYAAIGGTHLFRASEERIEETIVNLKEMGVQKLGVSHCTGFKASARLAQEFEDIFFLNNAGAQFVLP